ncbi:MAG: single-stranded-DNA-specific exonuclease RecJ [Lachnospiraceae bacterium]|nr:single-stranded-DNA-specific exonuclease RecJ [Lachnospiraceae bacterium]
MAKWMVAAKKADFNKIAEEYGITPVLARIMRNRDIIEEEEIRQFLRGTLEDLHDPYLLKDMEKAVLILEEKIKEQQPIRIIGDYDVDGICATFILRRGLSLLGAKADRVIPHRMKDGYGLNDSLISDALKDGIDTIVTCDNGIAAKDQILMAKENGMTVIVTDHHEVPFEELDGIRKQLLVEADAVVDPKREDCSYPFKQICGAVVAYKLIEALFTHRKKSAADTAEQSRVMKQKEALMKELLPFAALATVCDVMELKEENRIIVKYGLKQMRETENPGLKALLLVNGIEDKEISPYHAGFILGPCLNATGRLDTATRALSLFESEQKTDAVTIATDLKNLNDSRKKMTEDGVAEAIKIVESTSLKEDKVLVVYLPDCHESLAGIIAGKVKEKFGRPAFVLTRGEEGVKGSGRSIEAYDMFEEMTACKELFTKFGGHKMAAGLSLSGEEQVEQLRRRMNETCKLTEEDFEEVVHIDVPMPLSYAGKAFIRELDLLEPFGSGNPKPLFAQKNVSLISGKIMGKNRNVGKYVIADENGIFYDMIYFGDLEKWNGFLEQKAGREAVNTLYGGKLQRDDLTFNLAYYPDINVFAGRESVQIIMQHYC